VSEKRKGGIYCLRKKKRGGGRACERRGKRKKDPSKRMRKGGGSLSRRRKKGKKKKKSRRRHLRWKVSEEAQFQTRGREEKTPPLPEKGKKKRGAERPFPCLEERGSFQTEPWKKKERGGGGNRFPVGPINGKEGEDKKYRTFALTTGTQGKAQTVFWQLEKRKGGQTF